MQIICDRCGAVVADPELSVVRHGDIEHTYFVCKECGAAYPVSVTDGQLRKSVEEYQNMARRIREHKCSREYHRRMQKVKEENVQRSRELLKAYPLADALEK
ncbi:MAG: hypothetical protein SPL56_09585 [Lachnospiraceae bacterium]|nr:hypothetical protein [Lachnospiraceae bacterium]